MAQTAGNLGRPAQAALLSPFGVIACWEAFVHISRRQFAAWHAMECQPRDVDDAPERLWDWLDPQFLVPLRPIRELSPFATGRVGANALCLFRSFRRRRHFRT
jgi:hypothetical protein